MRALNTLVIGMNRLRCRLSKRRYSPDNVLVLLPHCLQNQGCTEPVKDDIRSCKGCGRCKIKDLRALIERFGVQASVAPGGEVAQARARSPDVHVILAVACNRELAEGIRATFPKKVYSVSNSWPHGPCKNTDVDVAAVEAALIRLLDHRAAEAPPRKSRGTEDRQGTKK